MGFIQFIRTRLQTARGITTWVFLQLVTAFPRYRTTTVSASFHHTTTVSNARATCRSLKYYNKFALRVRSLLPHNTSRSSFLNLPASSCFILRPSPLHYVFTVEQLLLACWMHVRCFLSLPLTLPTTVRSSSLERCLKLRNQLSCNLGLVGSV